MIVTLLFRGPLAKKFDGAIEIELEKNAILSELLSKLIEQEERIREVWSSPEVVNRDALVLCNEVDISLTGGLATELKENDAVVILPLIHGG